LPQSQRVHQPFVADAVGHRLIAPWPRGRELPGDDLRLRAVLTYLANYPLPSGPCWCWPDRAPEPIKDVAPNWVLHWMRDRCCYSLAPASPEPR
jgi:hypothetical protein